MDYPIPRIKLDQYSDMELKLADGGIVNLRCGTPQWVELTLLFHSHNFILPQTEGIATVIKFKSLQKSLLKVYQSLYGEWNDNNE